MKVVVEMDERDYNTMKNGFLVVGVTKGKPLDSVLDEIKVEIEKMTPQYHNPDWSITDLASISQVLEIIDKYKGEST